MVGFDVIEAQYPGERFQDLARGVLVAATFEPEAVVSANTGEERNLLTPKTGDSAPRSSGDARLLGRDQRTACAQVLPRRLSLLPSMRSTVAIPDRSKGALSGRGSAGAFLGFEHRPSMDACR